MMIKNLPKLIFLSGFMGAGKSTIGRNLAEKLGRPFLDLDDKIEEQAGRTIPEIFEESGEEAFREAERQALLKIIRSLEGVVALGGGSLQSQHLLDHIKINGLLVFIETPISVILDRISKDKSRPLLLNGEGNPKDIETLHGELQSLYEERLPLYQQAEITLVNDGHQSAVGLSGQLLMKIRNHVSNY